MAIAGLTDEELNGYRKTGFVILRDVFSADEMAELAAECDRLMIDHADLISPQNLRCRYMPHYQTGELLFEVFDPINDLSPRMAQVTMDPRIVSAVEATYGEKACLFKEKLIFKPPGALGYKLHQDIPYTWPGFPRTFLSVMIPIDACNPENGCTEVFSGYHGDFLSKDATTYMLPDEVVDASRRTYLSLKPGDICLFHGLTPHRSEPNKSDQMRRVFYVSYNSLSDGGDQRDHHYREFHAYMRQRTQTDNSMPSYFK